MSEIEIKQLINKDMQENITELSHDNAVNVSNLLSSKEMNKIIEKVKNFNENSVFSYETLAEISENISNLAESIKSIKEDVDTEIFFKEGYKLDLDKVKEKFNKKRLFTKYPNFNFKRLDELYKNPPETISPYYDESKKIMVDEYIFRKYLLGILQMVLDHMDLVIVVTGNEGSGKSTHVSQLMWQVKYILNELQIVEYNFDIKKTFFNTLENLRLVEDELFEQPFRILTLDEGNELHRQNWKDEEVQTFFQRLRRERFNQRIKFICIPVLGELMTNIVLSRVNFIHHMMNSNDTKSGSLNKGRVKFYIIPRGDYIYSPSQKKELSQGEIKTLISDNLKDKEYLKGMPDGILIKEYNCNGVWGFPEKLYEKELKETNKIFKVSKGYKLEEWESFCWYKARISLKLQGINNKDVIYASMNKSLNRLKRYFEEDPQKINKMNAIYERKIEEKELKDSSRENSI